MSHSFLISPIALYNYLNILSTADDIKTCNKINWIFKSNIMSYVLIFFDDNFILH